MIGKPVDLPQPPDTLADLIQEPPATIKGAIALLQYVAEAEEDGFEFPDGLVTDDEQKIGKSWSFFLHKNVAETFATYVGV